MFIIFVILDLLGLPFLAATSVSLFTKLTIKELQGFSQGIQRMIMGIGTISKEFCFRKKTDLIFFFFSSWSIICISTFKSSSYYDDNNANINSSYSYCIIFCP